MTSFNQTLRQCRCSIRVRPAVSVFLSALLVLTLSGSISTPARALESVSADKLTTTNDTAAITTSPGSLPTQGSDTCLALLHAARYDRAPSAMSRDASDRARSAAAVGLILGVRFALGPKEVTSRHSSGGRRGPSASFYVSEVGDTEAGGARGSHALAISAYRSCRNEQALKALSSEWRWSR